MNFAIEVSASVVAFDAQRRVRFAREAGAKCQLGAVVVAQLFAIRSPLVRQHRRR
jgi:hypothetical protein